MISFTMNYLAVIVAAASAIVLGFLWYGPFFGKPWMKAMRYTDEDMKKAKEKGMTQTYLLMTIGAILKAFVLASLIVSLSVMTSAGALSLALVLWIGFFVPLLMGDQLWGDKPWNLFVINAMYELFALGIMGVILAMWR